jgi:Sec-independent protein secretion pathway component TatC
MFSNIVMSSSEMSIAGHIDELRIRLIHIIICIVIITIFWCSNNTRWSGVTMWFVALPMIVLYAVGIIAIRRNEMSGIR